jgi:hypothetical protein
VRPVLSAVGHNMVRPALESIKEAVPAPLQALTFPILKEIEVVFNDGKWDLDWTLESDKYPKIPKIEVGTCDLDWDGKDDLDSEDPDDNRNDWWNPFSNVNSAKE